MVISWGREGSGKSHLFSLIFFTYCLYLLYLLRTSEIFGLLKQQWLIQPGPVETLVDLTINQESTRKWLRQPAFLQVVETTRN